MRNFNPRSFIPEYVAMVTKGQFVMNVVKIMGRLIKILAPGALILGTMLGQS